MTSPKFLLLVVPVLLVFSAVQCTSSSPEQAETAANDLTLVGGDPVATAVVAAASEETESTEATEPTPEVEAPETDAPEGTKEEATAAPVSKTPPTQAEASEPPAAPSANEKEAPANAPKTAPAAEPAASPRPDHSGWDAMLKANVSASGKVDYDGLKLRRAQLDGYLNTLRQNPPQSDWTRNEKLAYWINVYNAFTVDLILRNYPVKSIMDINGGKAWNLPVADIGGKKYTLDQVENAVIRPTFKEPRIHFAVNCAAASCPKLLNAA
ncbi:MAG: DUF547 domain-containing protein, partial [Bacteroidota bacterium]